MRRYFVIGQHPPYTRYAVIDEDGMVSKVQISRPEGTEVDRPHEFSFKGAEEVDVKVRPVNAQVFALGAGEQPRKVWNRVKRAAA